MTGTHDFVIFYLISRLYAIVDILDILVNKTCHQTWVMIFPTLLEKESMCTAYLKSSSTDCFCTLWWHFLFSLWKPLQHQQLLSQVTIYFIRHVALFFYPLLCYHCHFCFLLPFYERNGYLKWKWHHALFSSKLQRWEICTVTTINKWYRINNH